MPPGAIEASRWLRDHSEPRDLVATNSHCRLNFNWCDSRDFWLAAFSERQVILEGWSYTEPAFATGGLWDRTLYRSKFWKPKLLAANDKVFTEPTAERVAEFTTKHKVKWLVAVTPTLVPDPMRRAETGASPELGQFATERFKAGGANSLRGFETDSVGPKDDFGDPLYGQAVIIFNQEIRYRHHSGLGAAFFYDGGNVFDSVKDMSFDLRHVLGGGVRYASPVGLLRLDLGFPLFRKPGEKAYQLFFSFGQAF